MHLQMHAQMTKLKALRILSKIHLEIAREKELVRSSY